MTMNRSGMAHIPDVVVILFDVDNHPHEESNPRGHIFVRTEHIPNFYISEEDGSFLHRFVCLHSPKHSALSLLHLPSNMLRAHVRVREALRLRLR